MKAKDLLPHLKYSPMHAIWRNVDVTLDALNEMGKDTMVKLLGIEFTEIGEHHLRATMPVNDRTRQAYGILHGGASVALAETLGSVASSLIIDRETQICVGLEINANHLRAVRTGKVHGEARPLHIGKMTHVWDVRISDDAQKLVCVSRLTVAILPKKEDLPATGGKGKGK
ncbi:MAG TPA: hotdog fold thioesterase [Chitinophagaceae bacterium]|nr:hotdog fold thioesterase [Chitinophagaceae bacterium]